MTTHLLSYGTMADNLTMSGSFSVNPVTTTGLTFGYTGGIIVAFDVRTVVVAGTVSLTDDATNWVYENGSTVSANSGASPTLSSILYKVTTASGVITAIVDYRGALVTNKTSFT
jgi:hypothetical protein